MRVIRQPEGLRYAGVSQAFSLEGKTDRAPRALPWAMLSDPFRVKPTPFQHSKFRSHRASRERRSRPGLLRLGVAQQVLLPLLRERAQVHPTARPAAESARTHPTRRWDGVVRRTLERVERVQ